ncbi:MAG: [citrate (pro-3S)-lyase] ligase [Synergistaceae bacterium]|jgi:[citrate (pro-3S)-lyase] ligase|nr:[citrate (pro-3S)-lyase] ligase [Synergistaceae bacterium]
MNEYSLAEIRLSDKRGLAEADQLLREEGIRRDATLDYLAGLYDEHCNLIAVGGCFLNTLRCLAVNGAHRGEGLMSKIVSHLVEFQVQRGNSSLFLYTKPDNERLFSDLGFYEIARVPGQVLFMENRQRGFACFLEHLALDKKPGRSCALVMNCNPFTLGHRYLVEQAAENNDTTHLFAVSENASLFPFPDRYAMIKAGCADLRNVILHRTGSYMISNAVFPSYFLKNEDAVVEVQARLDLAIFAKIAAALGVTRRYVGEEPFSQVTRLYNEIMLKALPEVGIECIVVPRKRLEGEPISASRVRQLIHDDRMEEVRALVPPGTFDYFSTPAGRETAARIRASSQVVHH